MTQLVHAPQLDSDFGWLNTERPLRIGEELDVHRKKGTLAAAPLKLYREVDRDRRARSIDARRRATTLRARRAARGGRSIVRGGH